MVNFIPAWYHKNEWKEQEQYWYIKRQQTEMDDIVKQIQLFHRNKICDYRILLLSYAPNFRHFLHRQGAFRAPYISLFDLIQEVDTKKNTMFSFRQLNWPKDIEFIYTPFVIVAMLDGKKYAQIEFNEDGRTIEINFYSKEQIIRKNTYDDRGFLSSTAVYKNGKKQYDQYLSRDGIWKICHFLDGRVAINPERNYYSVEEGGEYIKCRFNKLEYESLEELLQEVLTIQIQSFDEQDLYIVAAHRLHQNMMDFVLKGKNMVLSIFADRFSSEDPALKRSLDQASLIVCDSEKNHIILTERLLERKNSIYHISPYDTRGDYSISQRLHVQNILLPVDSLSNELIETTVLAIAIYLSRNDKAMVQLFTRSAEYGNDTALLGVVAEALKKGGYPLDWCKERFFVNQCVDELSVSKCIREQRVMLDVSEAPDMFLQIACIGMGVPQILMTENEYMKDGENGLVIQGVSDIVPGIEYYLDNLSNWNKAAIASNEIQKEHATVTLVKQWKEVIEHFG